jgi:hypothetical protein
MMLRRLSALTLAIAPGMLPGRAAAMLKAKGMRPAQDNSL